MQQCATGCKFAQIDDGGWPVDADGVVDRTTLTPVRVSQQVFNPIATSNIEMSANIPAIAPPATPADAIGARP